MVDSNYTFRFKRANLLTNLCYIDRGIFATLKIVTAYAIENLVQCILLYLRACTKWRPNLTDLHYTYLVELFMVEVSMIELVPTIVLCT